MYQNIAVLFAFAFVYSLVAGRLERTPVAGALVFTAFGLVAGPAGLNWLTLDVHAQSLRTLAELTLALVLFTDAASADLRILKVSYAIPERLLLIGLPLTILLGTGAAVLLFPALGIIQCALLATMLAPTDAALGKAVVSNPALPPPIRKGLNVESGLNDGICVPVLLILLESAAEPAGGSWGLVLHRFVEEIGIGLAMGAGLALIGVWALRLAVEWGWTTRVWRQLPVAALAFATFAAAQALGGSGFIACFVGGLAAGGMARQQEHKHEFLLAAEGARRDLRPTDLGAVRLGRDRPSPRAPGLGDDGLCSPEPHRDPCGSGLGGVGRDGCWDRRQTLSGVVRPQGLG